MNTLDQIDARILLALDDDPEATVLGLARSLGIARNTVHARLGRMAANGVLRGYAVRVDPAALGYPLAAFLLLSISQAGGERVTALLAEMPQVVEIHAITGEADLLVKVVARDTADLLRVTDRMVNIEGVVRSNTAVSLVESMPIRMRALLAVVADDDR
jgi:DNA-binding Lrp family transcriptional regulator